MTLDCPELGRRESLKLDPEPQRLLKEHRNLTKAGLQDADFWQDKLGVQRAPSLVFLRGPGALPAIFDASNTKRLDIARLIADNAWQVILLHCFSIWLLHVP